MCGAVPPDRSAELEQIRPEIYGIEKKLEEIHQLKEDAVPPRIEQALNAGTVPTDNGVRTTSRKKSRPNKSLARKGVEPK